MDEGMPDPPPGAEAPGAEGGSSEFELAADLQASRAFHQRLLDRIEAFGKQFNALVDMARAGGASLRAMEHRLAAHAAARAALLPSTPGLQQIGGAAAPPPEPTPRFVPRALDWSWGRAEWGGPGGGAAAAGGPAIGIAPPPPRGQAPLFPALICGPGEADAADPNPNGGGADRTPPRPQTSAAGAGAGPGPTPPEPLHSDEQSGSPSGAAGAGEGGEGAEQQQEEEEVPLAQWQQERRRQQPRASVAAGAAAAAAAEAAAAAALSSDGEAEPMDIGEGGDAGPSPLAADAAAAEEAAEAAEVEVEQQEEEDEEDGEEVQIGDPLADTCFHYVLQGEHARDTGACSCMQSSAAGLCFLPMRPMQPSQPTHATLSPPIRPPWVGARHCVLHQPAGRPPGGRPRGRGRPRAVAQHRYVSWAACTCACAWHGSCKTDASGVDLSIFTLTYDPFTHMT
jgi:hypothetical protein